jgi:hypothetical protein
VGKGEDSDMVVLISSAADSGWRDCAESPESSEKSDIV